MAEVKATAPAHTLFLVAFRKDPAGPPPQQWPWPIALWRWLRRKGFAAPPRSLMPSPR